MAYFRVELVEYSSSMLYDFYFLGLAGVILVPLYWQLMMGAIHALLPPVSILRNLRRVA